ncbi:MULTISPECIES: hypothetical protein [Hymenobacter]|uniref:Uncharacterized protein n=2 Tax=Hymenobacter TaxID=89966 RepID=A0A7Y7PQR0_9BACT|nr:MULTISPECIES: hypothetical protein [Hymenobacter]NVO32304.1 hypothetical protein [Hymenobacter lapidiphilus]NVO86835.1 hypothetical protein [Hymenobacter terrestris]
MRFLATVKSNILYRSHFMRGSQLSLKCSTVLMEHRYSVSDTQPSANGRLNIIHWPFSLILLFSCCFMVAGCTVPMHFYVRNLSNTKIKCILIRTKTNTSAKLSYHYLSYSLSLKEPTFSSVKSFNKQLDYINRQDSVIFFIPPLSTVFIGANSNRGYPGFKSIAYFSSKYVSVDLNAIDLGNNFSCKKYFGNCNTFWMDLK